MIDMTIDEAIEELKSENGYYANNGMTDVAEFNTKIIRLLEELKELRVTVSELQCEMQATGALLNERDKETRNNAIDDFAEKLNAKCNGMIKDKWNSNVAPISWAEAYADFKDDIGEIAEQLKVGGENDNLRR